MSGCGVEYQRCKAMADLIERDALVSLWKPLADMDCFVGNVIASCLNELNAQPTVDAVPVVRGKWQEIRNAYGEPEGWLCECGREVKCKENYCPNCGAKMDGGRT